MATDAFPAIAALSVFVLTIVAVVYLVLHPVHIRLPCRSARRLHLSYCWAPLLGVALMLACTCIKPVDIAHGVVGDEHIKPYGILILFMALAYIAASLDTTGAFAWVALIITNKSKGRGHRLFFLYSGLSAIMTAFTSNDVSIMTLTPIIIYFAKATDCDPMPFLVAEFLAANLWSMMLFVGNPTNIIVAQAYNMTFLGYTKWMLLPTLASGLVPLVQLYFSIRRKLPVQLELPSVRPADMLNDRLGAVLGAINMIACLVLLAVAPSLGWELWIITLVCAVLHMVYNLLVMVPWSSSSTDGQPGEWMRLTEKVQRFLRVGSYHHHHHHGNAASAGAPSPPSSPATHLPPRPKTSAGIMQEAMERRSGDGTSHAGEEPHARQQQTPTQPQSYGEVTCAITHGNSAAMTAHAAALQAGNGEQASHSGSAAEAGIVRTNSSSGPSTLQFASSSELDGARHVRWQQHGDLHMQRQGSGKHESTELPLPQQVPQQQLSRSNSVNNDNGNMALAAPRAQSRFGAQHSASGASAGLQDADAVAASGVVQQVTWPATASTAALSAPDASKAAAAALPPGVELRAASLQQHSIAGQQHTYDEHMGVVSNGASLSHPPGGSRMSSSSHKLGDVEAAVVDEALHRVSVDPAGGAVNLAPPSRTFIGTFMCLPWEVVPFVLGMFILVEGLKVQGWVDVLAHGLGTASGKGGLGGALMLMGWLSVALSNLINNQPMTILLTTVALQPRFITAVDEAYGVSHAVAAAAAAASSGGGNPAADISPPGAAAVRQASLFALVVGSNAGALFTIMGALAGIMWANIMRARGVQMSFKKFVATMLPLGLTSTMTALLILWAEFAVAG